VSATSGPDERPQLMAEVSSFLARVAPLHHLPAELLVSMRTAASYHWPTDMHRHGVQSVPTWAYGWANHIDPARAPPAAGPLSVGGLLRSSADEETVRWAERQCSMGEPCWRTAFRQLRFVRQPDRSVRVTYVELLRSSQPLHSSFAVPPSAVAVLAIGRSHSRALPDRPEVERAAASRRVPATEQWSVRTSVALAAGDLAPRVYVGSTPCNCAYELGQLLQVEVALRGDGFHRRLVTRARAPAGRKVHGRTLNRTALAGCTLMQLVLVPAAAYDRSCRVSPAFRSLSPRATVLRRIVQQSALTPVQLPASACSLCGNNIYVESDVPHIVAASEGLMHRFIDMAELEHIARHSRLQVASCSAIDAERPASASPPHLVSVASPIALGSGLGSGSNGDGDGDGEGEWVEQTAIPVHARYQDPSHSAAFATFELNMPLTYIQCDAPLLEQHPEAVAHCSADATRSDRTLPIVPVRGSAPLTLQVPRGQLSHALVVSVLTFAVTAGSALALSVVVWRL
jgi:hypothetical protein